MFEVDQHTKNFFLEIAKKKIYIEGNLLKVLKSSPGDKEFEEYLQLCKEKDSSIRRKRLDITKQVQQQNKELENAASENERINKQLSKALEEAERATEEAKKSAKEAIVAKRDAEAAKDAAVNDLDLLQKKSQFELMGVIVKVALFVIVGVGVLTTLLYGIAIMSGRETQVIGSTWSNMFGILLTNAFSIVGTIMGVKYASEKRSE